MHRPIPRKTVPSRTNSPQHVLSSSPEPESDFEPPLLSTKPRPCNKTAPVKKSSAKKVSQDCVKKAKKRPYQKIPMAPLPAKLPSLGRDPRGNVKRRKPGSKCLLQSITVSRAYTNSYRNRFARDQALTERRRC